MVAYSTEEYHYGIWCILTHTWILHLSSRYEDPVKLYVVSFISDKLFSKSQRLVSYVPHHYAMAYVNGIC